MMIRRPILILDGRVVSRSLSFRIDQPLARPYWAVTPRPESCVMPRELRLTVSSPVAGVEYVLARPAGTVEKRRSGRYVFRFRSLSGMGIEVESLERNEGT